MKYTFFMLDNPIPLHYNILAIEKRPWLSWIERLATDQKVGGSNPSGRAINIRPFLFFEGKALFLSFHINNPVQPLLFTDRPLVWYVPHFMSKARAILEYRPAESLFLAAQIITFWAAVPQFTTFSLQHNEDVAYLTAHNEQLFCEHTGLFRCR